MLGVDLQRVQAGQSPPDVDAAMNPVYHDVPELPFAAMEQKGVEEQLAGLDVLGWQGRSTTGARPEHLAGGEPGDRPGGPRGRRAR